MKLKIANGIAAFFTALLLMSVAVFAATDTYTVQYGDSLWKIAVKYKVGISEIIGANPQFKDPSMIYPGDNVSIPLPDKTVTGMQEQITALVNQERAKHGLKPLTLNWQVSRVAQYKSEDMRDNKYFSHQSPTYGSPFDMLKKFGISYRTAGENIAKGQTSAAAVMSSWMNSEGHRKNILSSSFTEIGVGYCTGGGSTYWTQIFITP